jgi:hypothetical protein
MAGTPKPWLRRLLSGRRPVVIGMPVCWLLLFFLLPFLIVGQDQRLRDGERGLQGPDHLPGRRAAAALKLGNYIFITEDALYVKTYLASLQYAAGHHAAVPVHRLPVRLLHGARPAHACRPALLMLVMLPFWTSFLLRVYAWKGLLTEAAGCRRHHRPGAGPAAAGHGRDQHAGQADEHAVLAGAGHDLHLPALHDPAAVRQPGQAGPAPAGSRRRPRRHALGGVLEGDGAAVQGRHHRRQHAGVHPLRGRVRHPRTAGRPRDADDRPRGVGRVLQQQRLADGQSAWRW